MKLKDKMPVPKPPSPPRGPSVRKGYSDPGFVIPVGIVLSVTIGTQAAFVLFMHYWHMLGCS